MWLKRLENYASKRGVREAPKAGVDDEKVLSELQKMKTSTNVTNETKGKPSLIPQFYTGARKATRASGTRSDSARRGNAVREAILSAARSTFCTQSWPIYRCSEDDFKRLDEILFKDSTAYNEDEGWLDYQTMCETRPQVPSSLAGLLNASAFARLPKDMHGRVKTDALFHYVVRMADMRNAYLSLLEVSGGDASGMISVKAFQAWLLSKAKKMADIKTRYPKFAEKYAEMAARKFVFFLDTKRSGWIPLQKLVSSDHFSHFQEEFDRQQRSEEERQMSMPGPNGDPSKWFSPLTALKVYGNFLKLDSKSKDRLTPEQFQLWGQGGLSSLFIEQLWQVTEMPRFGAKQTKLMDFTTYLDFSLGICHRHTHCGLAYLWKVLDAENNALLSKFHVQRLIKSVLTRLREKGQEWRSGTEPIVNKIFGLIKPRDPDKIDFRDLREAPKGSGYLAIEIMIDAVRFWQFNNPQQQALMSLVHATGSR